MSATLPSALARPRPPSHALPMRRRAYYDRPDAPLPEEPAHPLITDDDLIALAQAEESFRQHVATDALAVMLRGEAAA